MSRAGDFEFEVWGDGYPVWIVCKWKGEEFARLSHGQISDLVYAAQKAAHEARSRLPRELQDEAML